MTVDDDSAIITAASDRYFPSVLNLIGSIKSNYKDHPRIFVYDLGLLKNFSRELDSISGVKVIKMPAFCSFYMSCYTWKTYVLAHPLARLNFYMDAGSQVLRPLDEIFEAIEKDDYFFVDQNGKFKDIVPSPYRNLFNLSDEFDGQTTIAAGLTGFKADSKITPVMENTFQWALAGLSLGFSAGDIWLNKGINKTNIVRDCKFFRHDLTLLNIAIRKAFGKNAIVHEHPKYGGGKGEHSEQVIWNFRLAYWSLDFLDIKIFHEKFSFLAFYNRIVIGLFIALKNIRLFVKKILKPELSIKI